MDPGGAEPARRIVPRGLRGSEPVPALEPMPGVPLEPVRAALRGDGQGPRLRRGHGCPVDAPRMPAGPRAAPRPDRAVLDGQDLAVRVRRERACGALPDAAGRNPRLARRLHGRPRRVQRGRLETEARPGSLAERRVRGRRGPCEFEAVRGRPPSDAPARVTLDREHRSWGLFPHREVRTCYPAVRFGLTGHGAPRIRYVSTYHAIVSRIRSSRGAGVQPKSRRAFEASTTMSTRAKSRATRERTGVRPASRAFASENRAASRARPNGTLGFGGLTPAASAAFR